MKHLLLPLLLCAGFVGRPAEARRLSPVDTCASDIGFATFRAALNRAIARRDAAFILSVAADDIQYSFGDTPGRAGFARVWGLAVPRRARCGASWARRSDSAARATRPRNIGRRR